MTIFAYALLALATSAVPDAATGDVRPPETAPVEVASTETGSASTRYPVLSAYDLEGVDFAQLTIQRRIFIRIPSARMVPLPPSQSRPRWKEKKGPKCIPTTGLGGFAITTPDSIDLFLKGGGRYRAHLEDDCPSIAFYSGFYIRPTDDGRICVGRDPIHSRAGGQCGIVRIRTLVPDE